MFKQLYEGLIGFFFTPIPVNIICIYRILIGAVSFAWGLLLVPTFLIWFSEHGLFSIETARTLSHKALNPLVWFHPNNHVLIALLCLYLATAFCLTIGSCTRFSSILTFLLMISFYNRNPYIFNGGDALLRLNLLILIFAPAGRMYSLDNWLRVQFYPGKEVATVYEPWTQRLLQLQLAILYWEAFRAKLNGRDWWDGTAVYYVTHLADFHLPTPPGLFDQLWICKLLTWSTLIFEMCMWSLIWFKPFRYWLLLWGLLVHMGFNWVLNIPIFQFIVLSNYILFVEFADVQRFFAGVKKLLIRARCPIH